MESEEIYENSNVVGKLELEEESYYENKYELSQSNNVDDYEITEEYVVKDCTIKPDISSAHTLKIHPFSSRNHNASHELQNQYQCMNPLVSMIAIASPKLIPKKAMYTINETRPASKNPSFRKSRVLSQKQQITTPFQHQINTIERRKADEEVSRTLERTFGRRRTEEDVNVESQKVDGEDIDISKLGSLPNNKDDNQLITDDIVYNKYESIRINDGLRLKPKGKYKERFRTCFSCISVLYKIMMLLLFASVLLISVLQYFLVRCL